MLTLRYAICAMLRHTRYARLLYDYAKIIDIRYYADDAMAFAAVADADIRRFFLPMLF